MRGVYFLRQANLEGRCLLSVSKKLEEMGINLPTTRAPVANYVPAVVAGNLVFVSGHVPRDTNGNLIIGKLGQDTSVEQGYEAARQAALACLASLQATIGDLDNIKQIVRLLCMVNCTTDFAQHPQVANGASDLLVEVFGERGKHARAAVGMAALPLGVCFEMEMVVETQ